jgi:hypothetical protein
VGFRQDLDLPDAGELTQRAAGLLNEQLAELSSHADLLHRRAGSLRDSVMREAVAELLALGDSAPPEGLAALLTDDLIAWLRQQFGQPKAQRRELSALVERLRGKELSRAEVLRMVEEWLGEGEGYVEVG